MILSETVLIGLNSQNIQYWLDRGYSIPTYIDSLGRSKSFKKGSKLEVRVSELTKKSNVKIKAKCKLCDLVREVTYSEYSDTCFTCNLTQYKGTKHPRYKPDNHHTGVKRVYNNHLMLKYGITVDQYALMFEKQNQRCAICKKHQNDEFRKFTVDHDHKTNKVRGLLCHTCNTGIGCLKDSTEFLNNAINYLENVA